MTQKNAAIRLKFTELRLLHALDARNYYKAQLKESKEETARLADELFDTRCVLRKLMDKCSLDIAIEGVADYLGRGEIGERERRKRKNGAG